MAMASYHVARISYADAMALVIERHYLHRSAPCSRAFGLFNGRDIRGVVCYGTPSSAPLRRGIAGDEHARNVVELTRLWVCDSVPKNGESFLIGRTLPQCGKEIVVSFADPSVGHIGVVYQATNWLYTGLSAKRTDWTIDGIEAHGQTIADKYSADEVRAVFGNRFSLTPRTRKHRYVFINARGARRAVLRAALKYPVLPYPKFPSLIHHTTP